MVAIICYEAVICGNLLGNFFKIVWLLQCELKKKKKSVLSASRSNFFELAVDYQKLLHWFGVWVLELFFFFFVQTLRNTIIVLFNENVFSYFFNINLFILIFQSLWRWYLHFQKTFCKQVRAALNSVEMRVSEIDPDFLKCLKMCNIIHSSKTIVVPT